MSYSGITGYYECGVDPTNIKPSEILKKADVKTSISNVTNCIREKIIVYDDLQSDAKSIAEGVSQICSDKFNEFANLFISKIKGSNNWNVEEKSSYRDRLKKIQSEQTLPFVLEWRSIIRNGWDKNEKPSNKEIPDKLFKVAI